MNKKLGLLLVLLVLLGGAYFVVKSSKTSLPLGPGSAMTKGSIAGLLGLGKNVMCTIKNPDGTTGTVYVSGDNMRGDFMTKGPDGGDMASSFVNDGQYMYMWSGNRGTKIKNVEETPEAPQGDTSTKTEGTSQQGADLNEEVDMECKAWVPDRSMFTPPANVTFTDYSQMMMDAQKESETMMKENNISSSVCDQIEDVTAKAQCLQALGGGN